MLISSVKRPITCSRLKVFQVFQSVRMGREEGNVTVTWPWFGLLFSSSAFFRRDDDRRSSRSAQEDWPWITVCSNSSALTQVPKTGADRPGRCSPRAASHNTSACKRKTNPDTPCEKHCWISAFYYLSITQVWSSKCWTSVLSASRCNRKNPQAAVQTYTRTCKYTCPCPQPPLLLIRYIYYWVPAFIFTNALGRKIHWISLI